MTKNPQTDILIVGQGLAGSILAHKLISYGSKVMVIDNDHSHSASVVAAGIINPINGHRLNLAEGFERYYPAAEHYYRALQKQLNVNLWEPLEQIRLIKNPAQLHYYHERVRHSQFADLFGSLQQETDFFSDPEFGTTMIDHSAMVHTNSLLQAVQHWLRQQSCLISAQLDYQSIKKSANSVSINGIEASTIVFCEGYQAINNPWLKDLPFKLSKGAVLTLETDTLITQLLNWGHWLVPHVKGAKLGSSYDWSDLSIVPTASTERKLIDSLHNTTTIRAKTLQHQCGIRPTTRHRKPFIGQVSKFEQSFCFNGFGSKGCLLIPYYAEMLCQHLLQQAPLPDDVTRWL